MKKIFFLLALLMMSAYSFSQTYDINLKTTTTKDFGVFGKGSPLNFSQLQHKLAFESGDKIKNEYYLILGESSTMVSKELIESLSFKVETIQDLWNVGIIKNVLCELADKGTQQEFRNEIEDDVLDFISQQQNYGLVFNDPCLENYIYGLIAKIAPSIMIDGRPSNVNLLIISNPSTNASMYPNGTLTINTGLLSALHSEDELVAILAHEIAHFVLDHSVQNINKQASRKKRAEFWAALATGVTAIAEGVAVSKNNYYIPGGATIAMAEISTSIASQVIDRLGMSYNHAQEQEADEMAVKALELLGYNRNALATALNRIFQLDLNERSARMYFQGYTHPALVDRINKSGIPYNECNPQFEKEVSFAVTSAARMKYEGRRFRQVLPLVNQNIKNNVATSEDYILKANCLLALKNDETSNNEIIDLIEKAKELDNFNINICKSEILANIRLNHLDYVQKLLETYIQKLAEFDQSLKDIQNEDIWGANYGFILSEQDWAKRMSIKIKSMQ